MCAEHPSSHWPRWSSTVLPLAAEPLPVRSYTTDDGLANDWVLRVRRDSRGLLWFCTYGGLSRFDGTRFVSFGIQDGLPYQVINDVFEDRQGRLWIATNGGGVARFRPDIAAVEGTPTVESARLADDRPANRVNVMHQDPAGDFWLGTDGGLFHATDPERMRFREIPLELQTPDRLVGVFGLASTPAGELWAATTHGLLRRRRDGRTVAYTLRLGWGEPARPYRARRSWRPRLDRRVIRHRRAAPGRGGVRPAAASRRRRAGSPPPARWSPPTRRRPPAG